MSIALMATAWKLDIPMTEKMVLLCLCDFANDAGECWPAIATIASKCSCSDRTVQNAIKALRHRGILDTDEAINRTHRFYISLPYPENSAPRKSCTPKMAAGGVKQMHPRGERAAPKPSKNHQEPSKDCASGDALTPADVFESWNDMAPKVGLPVAKGMTPSRLRQTKARLREFPAMEDWQRAFRHIAETPFLRGENDRGWRADFDFLVQAKSFTKLVEGSYGKN